MHVLCQQENALGHLAVQMQLKLQKMDGIEILPSPHDTPLDYGLWILTISSSKR